jgi:MFS family permease
MFFFVTIYLQQIEGYSPLGAGLAFLPMTLGVFAASSFAPRVIARFGLRRTLVAGMLSAAGGVAWFAGVHPGASYVLAILPANLLASTGMGLSLVSATIVAVEGVPAHENGLASGIVNSSRLIGGALGLAALTTIAESRTNAALADGVRRAQALTDGYGMAFRIGTVMCLAGAAIAAVLLREAEPQAAEAELAPEPAA